MAGEDFEYRLKRLEDDSERNSAQHREFYNAFKELEKQNTRTEERYNTILTALAETKTAIEELKGKPAKRWDALVAAIISAVVGIAVGLLLRGGV